jgi:hypothetical protein
VAVTAGDDERDEKLRQIEHQLVENEASTTALRQSIDGLKVPLDTLAEIQREQREIKQAAERADAKADRLALESRDRSQRARRVTRLAVSAVVLAILLVNFLTLISVLRHVNALQAERDAARYPACKTRNEQTLVNVRREQQLAAVETEPALRAIHQRSASETQLLLIDCDALYGKQPAVHGGH